ncbi:MAG: hypothetical protein KA163_10990 [Bacteroidia bacterium]|nr:hypothetical protein [Bacteroidia bacterium]
MKTITHILLFCFITLTVAPVVVTGINAVKSQCQTECGMMEEGETCPIADMECCPGLCNPSTCCFCCFMCTMDNKKTEIKIFETDINKQNSESQFDLSDFSSDCWQPPKMA